MSFFLSQSVRNPWPPLDEDPMTGLPNLFALLSDFPQTIDKTSGVAAIVDIRNMGSFNARYGRKMGDQLILHLSRMIPDALEICGLRDAQVYRASGDEFCVIAPWIECLPDPFLKIISRSKPFGPSVASTDVSSMTWSCSIVSVQYAQGKSDAHQVLSELWIKMQEKRVMGKGGVQGKVESVALSLVRRIWETLELLNETHRLAYTDDISGLPNHRAARYVIEQYMEKCKREHTPLSLLFIDGDNLRQYNDSTGYDSGNEMIRRLGAILSSATSPGDVVARWLSGDEFMVVLRNCSKGKATEKALQLCETVRAATSQWQFPITISIGVSSYPDDALDADGLIKKVEDANQKAKRAGKDRVCVHGGSLLSL